ncbi:hypothetical protein QYM36_012381 [Artemia franciscana]|uniref:DUF7805 domain-containing protein n=2 Tax=Artemia franciscana TaxID=6661 RepID=A0AA88HSN8_ARTSF|nr:hypothetical protein QYM36_012381 [Artemia franciscana]
MHSLVSSGNEILLVFTSDPVGNFHHPLPLKYPPGFKLIVEVFFVDMDTIGGMMNKNEVLEIVGLPPSYSNDNIIPNERKSAFKNEILRRNGTFKDRNSLLLNSALGKEGNSNQMLMISAERANNESSDMMKTDKIRTMNKNTIRTIPLLKNTITIYNPQNFIGIGNFTYGYKLKSYRDKAIWLKIRKYYISSVSESSKVCLSVKDGGDTLLQSCEINLNFSCHHANLKGPSRPCSLASESLISNSSEVGIAFKFYNWTFRDKLLFKFDLEIVDISNECNSFLNSSRTRGILKTPKNILLFGIGGSRNFICEYQFFILPNEYLKLQIFGSNSNKSELKVFEDIGRNIWVEKLSFQPPSYTISYEFSLQSVRLQYKVINMTYNDTPESNYLQIDFSYHSSAQCRINKELSSNFGNTTLSFNASGPCKKFTVVINSSHLDHYFTMRIPGFDVLKENGFNVECPKGNKIYVYASSGLLINTICPEWITDKPVTVITPRMQNLSNPVAAILEVVVAVSINFSIQWVELKALKAFQRCHSYCPDLGCLSDSLWCDGIIHCKNATDEQNCSSGISDYVFMFPLFFLTSLLVCIMCITMVTFYKARSSAHIDDSRDCILRGFEDYKNGYL